METRVTRIVYFVTTGPSRHFIVCLKQSRSMQDNDRKPMPCHQDAIAATATEALLGHCPHRGIISLAEDDPNACHILQDKPTARWHRVAVAHTSRTLGPTNKYFLHISRRTDPADPTVYIPLILTRPISHLSYLVHIFRETEPIGTKYFGMHRCPQSHVSSWRVPMRMYPQPSITKTPERNAVATYDGRYGVRSVRYSRIKEYGLT